MRWGTQSENEQDKRLDPEFKAKNLKAAAARSTNPKWIAGHRKGQQERYAKERAKWEEFRRKHSGQSN